MTPFVTQQGLDVAVQTLQKRIDAVNESVVTTNHNTLSGLQGGQSGQYYHLTAAAYGYLSAQDQYVKTTSSPSFTALTVGANSVGTKLTITTQVGDYTLGGYTLQAPSSFLVLAGPCGYAKFGNSVGYVFVAADGKVGIGTDSPATKLHVLGNLIVGTGEPTYVGTIRIENSLGQYNEDGGLEFISARSGGGYGWRITAPDLGTGETPLYIMSRASQAAWTTRLTILNNGNVGIGTVSPATSLHVKTIGGDACITIEREANSYLSAILYLPYGALSSSNNKWVAGVQAATDRYYIGTWDGSASEELFTILNNGNVGIGCSAPTQKLDVCGDAAVFRNSAAGNLLRINPLENPSGANIEAMNSAESGYTPMGLYASAFTFYPGGSAGVTIDASGNVGIGQATFGTSAAKVLAIGTGTAPSTSPADAIQFYSSDFAAGNACPYFRTENGTVIGLNQSLLTTDGPSFDHVHLTVAIGTAPLVVTSTTVVTNLNADLWDGYQFSDYLDQAVKIASSPTHAGLTIGTLAGLLKGTAGVVGAIAFDAVATHYLNGQGDWSIPSGTDPGGLGIYAAATIAVHNDTEKTTTSTTYVKVKEMKINEAWAGSWRLVFSITADGTHLAYGKVYVNSVAKGAEHSTALSDPTSFSDDITLNLAINDLIQIYAKRATGGTCAISSMMFEYAWHLTTIGAHTLTTPLNVTDTTVISFTNQDP